MGNGTNSWMGIALQGGLNNGVSKEEIRAIIHCVGIYGGVPLSLECFRAAKKVLAERNIE